MNHTPVNHTTVLPPNWWSLPPAPADQRLLHLLLMAQADRDGVVQLDTTQLAPALGTTRVSVVQLLDALEAAGLLAMYPTASGVWAWLPHVAEYQPTRGKLQRPRDPALPAPPRDRVVATLAQLWGRQPTTPEARAACPRAWGRSGRSAGSTGPAPEAVAQVWEAWRARQDRPEACRLGVGARAIIARALGETTPEHLLLLLRFAYEADAAGPRFWRGANDQRRTYLGLDNLLRLGKLQERLQHALAWDERQARQGAQGDGTTLGPLASYRRPRAARPAAEGAADQPAGDQPADRTGPAGTTSTPAPRPLRLSTQCRRMLGMLVQRGPAGVRTSELARIGLKYTGRISELRGVGCDVYVAERDPGGDNLYVMRNAGKYADGCPQCRALVAAQGCLLCGRGLENDR